MGDEPLRRDQLSEDTTKDLHRRPSISTQSGIEAFPLDPSRFDVRLEDVVNAISNKCRFTGQPSRFYSVAEHCVHVARVLLRIHGDPRLALWGLLHDASEAYLPDISSPLKPRVYVCTGPDPAPRSLDDLKPFREVEAPIVERVVRAHGLSWPEPKEVKVADAGVFRWERPALFPPCDWWSCAEPDPLYRVELRCFLPASAKSAWVRTYRELLKGC